MKFFCALLMVFLASEASALEFSIGPAEKSALELLEVCARGDSTVAVAYRDSEAITEEQMILGSTQIRDLIKNPMSKRAGHVEKFSKLIRSNGKTSYTGLIRVEEDSGQSYLLEYSCEEGDKGTYQFNAFRLTPISEEMKKRSAWGFMDRPLGRQIFFVLGILAAVFSVYTAVHAWRHAATKRVLWMILATVAWPTIAIEWVPGETSFLNVPMHFRFSQVNFFGFGLFRSGTFNPFILTVGVPVFALVYWMMAKRKNASERLER